MPKNLPTRPGKTMRLRTARAFVEGRELHVPARNVITRSKVRILRQLYSVKMRCFVPTESGIEYDHYALLDVRPDIRAFYAQPEKLVFRAADGTDMIYFPDARVEYADGRVEMHEVKPDEVADLPEVDSRHKAIALEYRRRGILFVVIRESEVRREPALSNAKLLRRYRVRSVPRPEAELIRGAVARGVGTLGEVVELLGRGAEGRADVLSLALHGQIEIDLQARPIGAPSRLSDARKGGG